MLGRWLNTTQLFGRLTPCRILKPLSEYRYDSQKNLPAFRKLTYKDRLRRLHLPRLELSIYRSIWCGAIKYYLALLTHQQRISLYPVHTLQPGVINTNYLRSPMFHVQGLTFSVNVL